MEYIFIGILRRCLAQQCEVRTTLYEVWCVCTLCTVTVYMYVWHKESRLVPRASMKYFVAIQN